MKCPRRLRRRPVGLTGKSVEWSSVQTMYLVELEVALGFRTSARPTVVGVSCVDHARVGYRVPMSARCMSWKVAGQRVQVRCAVHWCGRHLAGLVA